MANRTADEEYIQAVYDLRYLDSTSSADVNASLTTTFFCTYVVVVEGVNGSWFKFTTNEDLDAKRLLCNIAEQITLVICSVCVALGVPGNSLAIATMATMPKSTGTFYILVLAISDLIALIGISLKFFLQYYGALVTNVSCMLSEVYATYPSVYANWMLVLISLERFVTIRFPLKKRYYFTMRKSRISVGVLAIPLVPLSISHLLSFHYNPESRHCQHTTMYLGTFYEDFYMHFLYIIYSFLPAAFILVFCVLVAIALRKHKKERDLIMGNQKGENTTDNLMRQHRLEAEKAERSITLMMFFAFLIFVIVSVPICISIIYLQEFSDSEHMEAWEELMYRVAFCLPIISRTLNFYIYFLSARKFRSHLYKLKEKVFCSSSRPNPTQSNQMETSVATETHELVASS